MAEDYSFNKKTPFTRDQLLNMYRRGNQTKQLWGKSASGKNWYKAPPGSVDNPLPDGWVRGPGGVNMPKDKMKYAMEGQSPLGALLGATGNAGQAMWGAFMGDRARAEEAALKRHEMRQGGLDSMLGAHLKGAEDTRKYADEHFEYTDKLGRDLMGTIKDRVTETESLLKSDVAELASAQALGIGRQALNQRNQIAASNMSEVEKHAAYNQLTQQANENIQAQSTQIFSEWNRLQAQVRTQGTEIMSNVANRMGDLMSQASVYRAAAHTKAAELAAAGFEKWSQLIESEPVFETLTGITNLIAMAAANNQPNIIEYDGRRNKQNQSQPNPAQAGAQQAGGEGSANERPNQFYGNEGAWRQRMDALDRNYAAGKVDTDRYLELSKNIHNRYYG